MFAGLPMLNLRPDAACCPQKTEFHLHFEGCFGTPMSTAKAGHPQTNPSVSRALEPSPIFTLCQLVEGIRGLPLHAVY
jgi:hypothetical protein